MVCADVCSTRDFPRKKTTDADWRRRGKPRCAVAPVGARGPSARAARAASPEAERAEAGPGGGGDGLEGVSNASGSRQTNEARTETTDVL